MFSECPIVEFVRCLALGVSATSSLMTVLLFFNLWIITNSRYLHQMTQAKRDSISEQEASLVKIEKAAELISEAQSIDQTIFHKAKFEVAEILAWQG